VLAHLSADVRKYLVTVVKFHPKHCIRERLHDGALDLDGALFFGHAANNLTLDLMYLPVQRWGAHRHILKMKGVLKTAADKMAVPLA